MEEHGLDGPVIGIAFDGTGYGTDGTLWGSEFLVAGRGGFRAGGPFLDFPLPGGESAIRDVWKIGLSLLYQRYGDNYPVMERDESSAGVIEIIKKNINSPLTCSIGRIFDGVAAILGIARSVSAEAEAAQLLEEAAMRGRAPEGRHIVPFSAEGPIVIGTEELADSRLPHGEGNGGGRYRRGIPSGHNHTTTAGAERDRIGPASMPSP